MPNENQPQAGTETEIIPRNPGDLDRAPFEINVRFDTVGKVLSVMAERANLLSAQARLADCPQEAHAGLHLAFDLQCALQKFERNRRGVAA